MIRTAFARSPLALLLACLVLAACTAAPAGTPTPVAGACAGEAAMDTRLYFGLSRADGEVVTVEDWSGFVEQIVAPAFSSGFTVLEADGYWRDAETGRTLLEASRVVVRIHPGDSASESAIDRVIAAYKRAFDQQSVLRTDAPVCARF